MSRKDFCALAAAMLLIADRDLRRMVAGELASHCKRSNPNFDRARFMEACGL